MTDTADKEDLTQEFAVDLELDDRKTNKKTNFQKYAESNSVGGLPHVLSGSSLIRRILWLLIVLCCLGFSFYLLRNSVGKLIVRPTATTITSDPNLNLDLPAVTICNLNWFSASLINDPNAVEILREVYIRSCTLATELFPARNSPMGSMIDQNVANWLFACIIGGNMGCSDTDFDVSISNLGVCYTFNSGKNGKPILKANATGFREGIQVWVNIREDDYVGSFGHSVGVKVIVHPQSEPPLPDERGVYVAPGTSASIGIRKHIIDDQTKRNCTESDTPYATCVNDKFYARLRNNCSSCFSGVIDEASADQALNTCPFSDLCCYIFRFYDELEEPCLPQCKRTQYDVVTSTYSRWPTQYFASFLSNNFNPQLYSYDMLLNNYMSIDVYYSSLTVETQTTFYTYGFEEFLAEVGGQLGLCIGISIISLFEFIVYIFDEIKDRCCKRLCCRKAKKAISVI